VCICGVCFHLSAQSGKTEWEGGMSKVEPPSGYRENIGVDVSSRSPAGTKGQKIDQKIDAEPVGITVNPTRE